MNNLNLPKLSAAKSTKDQIISLLSENWPLSAKEIYNRLQREQASEITYQAVHKTLGEMSEEGILTKEEKGYRISDSWIKNLKEFSNCLLYTSPSPRDS